MLIDYDTVPAAIFVFVVLLQVAGWQCLSRPAIASSCFFLSGALIPLCVFAKITYVLGCLYVCTPVVVSFCYVDVGKREAACTFSLMVAGSIAGGMVVAAILLSRGGLLEYVNVVRQIVDGNALTAKHSSVSLVGEFCHQLVAILKRMPILASVLVVSLVVFLRASSRFSTRVGFVSVLLLIGLACFAFCSLKSSVIARSEHAYFLTGGLGLGALWVLAQWYLYGKSAGKITPGEVTLFAGALFAVLLGPLGSDKVFLKVGSGAWLLVPVVFLEIGRSLTRTLSFEADCYVSRSSVFALALISAFAGISVLVRSVSVHKDSQSRVDMVAAISHNKLRGVYTTVERARVLQGLLDELKSHVSEGDEMIAFRSTPMVNFLTGTVTPLSSAWPEIMPHAMLERDLSDLASTGNMPKVAVAALVNPVDRDWEARTPISFTGQSAIIADFLSEFNYWVVWQNKCFVIYRRP